MVCWNRDRISRVVCIVAVAFTLGVVRLAGVSAHDSTSALASLGLPELTVTITDTGIEAPAEAAAGLTYITLDNQTESISDATFVAQPEGRTLEQITADLQQVDTLPDWVYTTAFVGGPVAPAGGTGAAIVDLSAGIWLIAQTDTETPLSPAASPAAGIVESMVDVDGRALHVACAGTGSPTVLFEPGGPFLDGGTAVVATLGPDLAAALGTRFCSYDRAGTGGSDPYPDGVRTFTEAAADLRAVLASPELDCPCVVIGESLGGSIALVALAEETADVAGLVLLDPPYPGFYDKYLALAPPDSPEAGPETATYNGGENEERLDLVTGFGQVTAPAEPLAIPVIVISHGAGDPPGCWPCSEGYPVAELEVAWQAGQAALADSLGGRLVVAEDTGHDIAGENPELVLALTAEVIAAVRDPSTWATPNP